MRATPNSRRRHGHCGLAAERKPSYTREQFAEVRRRLGQDVALAQIARDVGESRETVYRIEADPVASNGGVGIVERAKAEGVSRKDAAMDKILAWSIPGAVCFTAATTLSAQPTWSIVESKSPTDNSPQVSAGLVVGDAALILRCQEKKTEVAYSTKDTYLGDKPVTIRFRINSQDPIKEIWRPSMNGRAAFASNPEDFIRALPDNGRVFIRALTAVGVTKDTNFILSGVSEIKEKIARACNWPSVPKDTRGSINPSQKR